MIEAISSIQIYNPHGYVYENGNGGVDFPITDSCERSAKVMGEDFVRLVFKLEHRVTFDAFSYIEYNGQTFFLREQYIPTPNGSIQDGSDVSSPYYSYDVKFVSVGNMLDKHVCYRYVKVNGEKTYKWYEPEININGNLETLYVIVMGAIKRIGDEYAANQMHYGTLLQSIAANGLNALGTAPNKEKVKITEGTKLLTFNFSGDNIANVCTTVANNFTNDDNKDTEWYITEEWVENDKILTMHFAKFVSDAGEQVVSDYIKEDVGNYHFAHPYVTGGLKKVEYAQAWSGITQTIVPYGSDRNMSGQAVKGIDEITQMQSMFGKRLRLDPNTSYNVKDKDGNVVVITTDHNAAIENNYVNTGIEQVKFYDDIYPQGHFKITKVEVKNKRQEGETIPEYTIEAKPIDSNGNDIEAPADGFYPIKIEEGTTLSVRFEKGMLSGREFEIANKTRKDEGKTTYSLKFTIVADGSIEDGTLIPSGNFKPYENDEFALFNMKMPEVYVEQAKQELAQKAYDELVELQTTRPEIKCTTDPVNFAGEMALGNVYRVSSELFNSEHTFVSRVISYSYKLTKTNDIQFSLASAIMQGTLSSMNDMIADVTHATGGLEQRAINLSRRAWRDASEVAEMIDSITTEMMLVGNEKNQFGFTMGIECVDASNKFSYLEIGYGSIQHTQEPYIDYANNGWWEVGTTRLSRDEVGQDLNPDWAYYLYAKVDESTTAQMVLSVDDNSSNEAYLLLGILSSEFEGKRVFSRTNGFTAIEGGTITTEQIQDAGRNLIIDFQSKRIIARNGAEIIGNIKFKASDEMTAEEQLAALGIGVGNAQSAADAAQQAAEEAKKQAAEEAAQIRKDYAAAIAESEDNINEELAAKVAEINGGIDELKKQIDGEVSSYFYNTAPVETDETILTNKEPFSEWAKNYTLLNGVYVLKENARNEFVNHIGDTYTNMEEYKEDSNGNTTTPLAGLAWRWCDATTVSPLPAKYITVSYKGSDGNNITKKLHWHKIADSDAVKALQEAAKAQSTADGKSTTFIEEPKNYDIGDLWILAADRTLNGNTYKQGTILTANAASATFVASHWGEKVKYIDESIAAQQAQQALDELELGGRNLLRNSATFTLVSGSTINFMFRIHTPTVGLQPNTNYVFSVDKSEMTAGSDTAFTVYLYSGDIKTPRNKLTIPISSTRQSVSFKTTAAVTDTDVVLIYAGQHGTTAGKAIKLTNIKLEQGTKATDWTPAPEDVDAAIEKAEQDAADAKASADIANAQLDAIDNDNVIAISERAALETQLEQIEVEYNEIVSDMERNNLDPTSYEEAADRAIEALQYHCGKVYDGTNTAPINADKSITIVAGTSVGYGYGNISAYYTARQTALESIADAVKASAERYADNAANDAVNNLEVGGTNLLDNSKPIRLGDWGGDGATVTFDESTNSIKGIPRGNYPRIKNTSVKNIGFIAGKYYTLSMDVKANAVATRSAAICNNSGSVVALSFGSFSVSTSWNRIKLTALCQDHNADVTAFGMYIYCGTTNAKDNTEFLQIRNIKLEEGKLATSWSPSTADTELEIRAAESKAEALAYLTEVLEDSENTTDIAGGLVMTNVMMLKDLANAGGSVGAGMSGVKADNILMWGGGTYEDAVHAKDNDFKKLSGSEITTLIKKDGTSKIGIFKISETQAVVDVPNQGKVIIDASTTNGGIRVLNSSGRINAALLPTSISSFKPLANSSTTGREQSVYYSMSTQSVTSTSKTIALSRTGSFTTSGTTTETLEQYTKKTTITTASTRVGGNTVTLNGSITTSNHDMFVRVTCELLYNGDSIYSINYIEEVQVGYNYISLSNVKLSFPNSITTALTVSNSINMQLKVTVTITGASSMAYIDAVSLNVSMGSIYMFYKATTAVTYTYPPQTIIGSDGLISLVSNSKYFMVDNSGSTQKIYAKGLGTSGDSGQLIKKSGAYKAFAQSLVDFMHQYIKGTAKESGFSNALNALAEDLPDDVFITAVE